MNREKESQLPLMQVNFIDSICLPVYEAFSVLSDKLTPLVDGVRENKMNWLKLAQNVQNAINLIETSTTTTTTTTDSKDQRSSMPGDNEREKSVNINNNNPIDRRMSSGNSGCADENNVSNNGIANDIPKIVGKLGRMDSNSYFQFKSNGIISETLTRDHTVAAHVDGAMNQ